MTYHNVFIHSLDEHVLYSQFGTMTDTAAMSFHVQIFVLVHVLSFLFGIAG